MIMLMKWLKSSKMKVLKLSMTSLMTNTKLSEEQQAQETEEAVATAEVAADVVPDIAAVIVDIIEEASTSEHKR